MSLTAARLRQMVSYDPLTGIFTRRVSTSSRARAGQVAGFPHPKGYVQFNVDGRRYLAHRLAWLYVTGEWPVFEIDHWDTDKKNNRFGNLRDVTGDLNQQNQHRARSSTGFLGVHPVGDRFSAAIGVAGQQFYLGRHDTAAQASAAYLAAKRELHPGSTI